MITCMITDAVVISRGTENAVEYSQNNGTETATFQVGVKMYDTRYKDNYRYNNIWISAYGDAARKVKKLNIRRGSCVEMVCRMDFSVDVLDRQASEMEKSDANYGRSRYVKGLKMNLIDINYGAISSGKPEPEHNEGSRQPDETINLDENNILERKPKRYF